MDLEELAGVIKEALGILQNKLIEDNSGYGDFSHITGKLDPILPEIYILSTTNVYGLSHIESTQIFKL